MKKTNPKMILNLSVEDIEFENKVKLAVDEYVDKIIVKDLHNPIARIVEHKINNLVFNNGWIDGVTFDTFVRNKIEEAIIEIIDKDIVVELVNKNVKNILMKNLTNILGE